MKRPKLVTGEIGNNGWRWERTGYNTHLQGLDPGKGGGECLFFPRRRKEIRNSLIQWFSTMTPNMRITQKTLENMYI